jgi:CheY-like chemotaxis protein/signal transduction histidine kinase
VVPLPYLGRTVGVIELALMQPCSARVRELLAASREPVVIALQVARSRQTQQQLLTQARALAEKLAAQEEELRLNNQELESQQDVLRTANEELESQRRVLSEKNDELEAARVSLQQKAEELTRMSSYKSQFLANMSHELRTPLNSMLILSHLLAENEGKQLSNKQVEYARTIHSAGQDLLSLINQVLDLAKIEAGRQEIHVEPVPVVSVVKHVRRVFEPLAREKGLQLKIEVAQEVPQSIATDRQRLERILTNLLGNAIKFTENGHVALRVRRPRADETVGREGLELEHCIAFEVSDTGIGIAQADAQRVFAPFEQVEGGIDRRHAGTGLGLAISRESAGLIGGELRLLAGPGPGSTFVCYLPEQAPQARVIEALAAASEGPAETTGMRPAVTGEAPGLHLLIVEDDTLIADQLVEIVEERGLSVQVARTGQQALEIARSRRPRGIVLDVKLPDIDGWAVMERLRADAATTDIPVHFISAIDSPQRGIALGAVGYLTKPISRDELVGMVRVLVPASEANSPRILVVEDDAKEGASLVELLRAEPIDVLHVRSAQDALGQLAQGGVGCMILDLGLPDMDGLGLLETLRARSDIQYPRVIVHTGRALTRKETRELNAYAEAIILKDGDSAKRLLEEIRLFVRHLKDGLQLGSSPAIHHLASDLSLQGVTLLLAEDDMRTVYALSALLRSKGAEVLVAETGREALQLLEQNPNISLVLMDIMMPEMDGYEAMRQLRSKPRFNQLPVIALTAKAMKGERDRCLEAGASDYLAKPVSSERLFETLGAWLAQPVQDGAVPANV